MLPFSLASGATLPSRGTAQAAGLDLYASADANVPARGRVAVETGVQVQIPPGFFGAVRGRSSLAFRSGIVAFEGTIDADYRGNISVLLINHSDDVYEIKTGERVAQLVVVPCINMIPVVQNTLHATDRGGGGFGSTGR